MTGLHNTGEEFMIDTTFRQDDLSRPASVDVGLYHDATDALADADDVAAISTEPTGSAYSRQTKTLDSADFQNSSNSGDWESIMADATFDTSDSTQDVDSYFVVVSFDSDDAGAAGDHLFFTGSLDANYDLSNVDSFTLSGAGIRLN